MPDPVTLEASRQLLEYGPLGAIIVLLMAVIVFQYRTYRTDIASERAAHQKTSDALLAEIRSSAALAESIRDQQKAMETAINAVLAERDRR